MPTYNYLCTQCEHGWEASRKIADRDEPLTEKCPSCEATGKVERRLVSAPSLGDPIRLGVMKTDGAFKDVMKRIHQRTPGSILDRTSTVTKI